MSAFERPSLPLSAADEGKAVRTVDEVESQLLARSAGRRRRDRRHLPLMLGTVAVAVGIWQALPMTGLANPLVLPTPVRTAEGLWVLIREDFFWEHLRATMYEVVVGYVVGVAIGFLGGTVLALSSLLRRTLSVYVYAVQSLPKVVLAPLFIAWLGFGPESKIATAVAICFFPVMINTMVGLQLAESDWLRLMHALRASRWQIYRKVQLPAALPLIFVGLKNALLLAFTGALIAEILIGGGKGLGTLVHLYNLQIRMHLAFAVVAIVAILSFVLVIAFDRLDRRVVFWRQEGGAAAGR